RNAECARLYWASRCGVFTVTASDLKVNAAAMLTPCRPFVEKPGGELAGGFRSFPLRATPQRRAAPGSSWILHELAAGVLLVLLSLAGVLWAARADGTKAIGWDL